MHLVLNPSDIYYLTGVRSHDPGEILMIQDNKAERIHNKEGIIFCDARTSALFDAEKYHIIRERAKWCEEFAKYPLLATDPDFLTQSLREKIEWYGVQLEMQKSPITEKRTIKTSPEIEFLQVSQSMNKKVYEMILPFLVPGVSEEEIALKIQILQLELWASGSSFPPIVAFWENSAIPHHSPTWRELQKSDIVLIDMGLIWKGYCSDMTRCTIIKNKAERINNKEGNSDVTSAEAGVYQGISGMDLAYLPTGQVFRQAVSHLRGNDEKDFYEIYTLLQNVTHSIISWAKPGMKVSDLDKKARKMLWDFEPYFTHSLGHGVGIDIHESPRISSKSEEILQPWMVITIEPGIYIPGKYGARYEEMIVVTSKWLELL